MGQKTRPDGFRVGINKNWDSRWMPAHSSERKDYLVIDQNIRKYFSKYERSMFITSLVIELSPSKANLTVTTARRGAVLGKDNETIKKITRDLQRIVGRKTSVNIDVVNEKNPDSSAKLLAVEIAQNIERRVSFRMAQKWAIRKAMRVDNVKGIKTQVIGRLNGVDMARKEGYTQGRVPLQTIRSDIDYAVEEAHTTFGVIGVKVWIYKGEILSTKDKKDIVKGDK
ncbi:MAG: 30S ribosomal protein S3 [Mycoplasmataceae bacterium]|nr:30S ribosomal protein S3 [Mycoplasmataceae bacterium]